MALDRNIWRSRISVGTKLRLCNSCILPICMYGADTCSVYSRHPWGEYSPQNSPPKNLSSFFFVFGPRIIHRYKKLTIKLLFSLILIILILIVVTFGIWHCLLRLHPRPISELVVSSFSRAVGLPKPRLLP